MQNDNPIPSAIPNVVPAHSGSIPSVPSSTLNTAQAQSQTLAQASAPATATNAAFPGMVAPGQVPSGAPVGSTTASGTTAIGATAIGATVSSARPAHDAHDAKSSHRGMLDVIILVIVSLVAVTFIGLFIWKYLEWDSAKTDVDGQIDSAVAIAIADNTAKLEAEFAKREEYPLKTFTGPADYGSVSFEYPKTWNVYVAKDAVGGGDYEAYLNPGEVLPVSSTTINALRFSILTKSFERVVSSYESLVKSGKLAMVTRNIGSSVANIYAGDISNNIRGIVTIFKVRTQTVVIQTDSELFAEEYYKLLDTVTFAE